MESFDKHIVIFRSVLNDKKVLDVSQASNKG